jgi:hypothetical protein
VRLCIPALLLVAVAAGCGGDDDAAPVSTVANPSIAPVTVDTADLPAPATIDTADLPAPPTVDTADLPTPVNTGDLPVQIRVTVGVDSGAARVEQVPLGASVILAVTNPDSADEFHLHGYDLGEGITMPAGQTETFNFTADQAGQFELESHESDDVLLVLSVG